MPKQGYTCCFAMDGVKVLASGFEADEKVPCLWYVYVFLNFMCELLKKVAPVLKTFLVPKVLLVYVFFNIIQAGGMPGKAFISGILPHFHISWCCSLLLMHFSIVRN